MARPVQEPARTLPRLYVLVAAPGGAAGGEEAATALRSAGETLDIAAVLLRPEAGADDKPSNRLRPLVAASHAIGAACLIEANTALALALEADGAHLDGPVALKGALAALRPNGIAGAGGLRTKHDAMTAAEAGADYVMFGEPDAQGRRPPFETTLERTDWWVQLFEPPCVAYAGALDEVLALAIAGADFIAIEHTLLAERAALAEALAGASA
ncbi:thiamine phosphate synthase [Ancylobacter sp. WKF20]|uniref:thiamine phosphate synthase n=1 Tax=Ancylobacter sp. WKF20 TaxID=3039801 RepID=UPI002434582E|nr:thiamine phosphate synthase [Ancylobacter sp. WKF20]WGD28718.1 thiamine phosphate synthase [Ancylobacter sp. WKF20]